MATSPRFALAYSPGFAVLARVLGTGPARARIELDETSLEVRMGWAFSARIARSDIAGAERRGDVWYAVGVHTTGNGTWIVNGTTRNIVAIRLDPEGRARALGFRVRLRQLVVSVDRPEDLVASLAPGPAGDPAGGAAPGPAGDAEDTGGERDAGLR